MRKILLLSAVATLSLAGSVNAQSVRVSFSEGIYQGLVSPGITAINLPNADYANPNPVFYYLSNQISSPTVIYLNSNTAPISAIPAGAKCIGYIFSDITPLTLTKLECTASVQSISVTSVKYSGGIANNITTASGSYALPGPQEKMLGLARVKSYTVTGLPISAVATKSGTPIVNYTINFTSPISFNAVFNNWTLSSSSC